MQTESFIASKDASLESVIQTMQQKQVVCRFELDESESSFRALPASELLLSLYPMRPDLLA